MLRLTRQSVRFPGLGTGCAPIRAGEPADFPPLQAADIWAYSLGHVGERQEEAKEEARLAFNFFVKAAHASQLLGYKPHTFFDREEMLLRLGEPLDTE